MGLIRNSSFAGGRKRRLSYLSLLLLGGLLTLFVSLLLFATAAATAGNFPRPTGEEDRRPRQATFEEDTIHSSTTSDFSLLENFFSSSPEGTLSSLCSRAASSLPSERKKREETDLGLLRPSALLFDVGSHLSPEAYRRVAERLLLLEAQSAEKVLIECADGLREGVQMAVAVFPSLPPSFRSSISSDETKASSRDKEKETATATKVSSSVSLSQLEASFRSFAMQLGNVCGVGRRECSNGIVLVIATSDRYAYLLTATAVRVKFISTAQSEALISFLVPKLKEGDVEGALHELLDQLSRLLLSQEPFPLDNPSVSDRTSFSTVTSFVVVALCLLAPVAASLVARNRSGQSRCLSAPQRPSSTVSTTADDHSDRPRDGVSLRRRNHFNVENDATASEALSSSSLSSHPPSAVTFSSETDGDSLGVAPCPRKTQQDTTFGRVSCSPISFGLPGTVARRREAEELAEPHSGSDLTESKAPPAPTTTTSTTTTTTSTTTTTTSTTTTTTSTTTAAAAADASEALLLSGSDAPNKASTSALSDDQQVEGSVGIAANTHIQERSLRGFLSRYLLLFWQSPLLRHLRGHGSTGDDSASAEEEAWHRHFWNPRDNTFYFWKTPHERRYIHYTSSPCMNACPEDRFRYFGCGNIRNSDNTSCSSPLCGSTGSSPSPCFAPSSGGAGTTW